MNKTILYILKNVNIWKTLYFNIHYFPLKVAVKLPVFICWRTCLYKNSGHIVLEGPIYTGMVRIGAHEIGTQDMMFSRTIWDVSGTMVVKGFVNIGRGCKVSIANAATLVTGKNFSITGKSAIICHKRITFGDDCLLSWDILIMDTDFHHIFDTGGRIINEPRPIMIGNHVWIGCRCMILKGVVIGDNNIISANSTITRSFTDSYCVIGGHGKTVEVLKKNITWTI